MTKERKMFIPDQDIFVNDETLHSILLFDRTESLIVFLLWLWCWSIES